MTIREIQLANTFDVWRITTNQLITISNDLKEGNLLSTGTISLDNSGGFQNNVALNVRSGMIYGDAGLLSNVGKPASITNQKLQNNTIVITPTQRQIILSNNTITLGGSVYLNEANLVTVNTDTSVANIASANLVNSVHVIATRADVVSNAAYTRANVVNVGMIAAFDTANTANIKADAACTSVLSISTILTLVNANATSAFTTANIAIANVNYVNTAMQASFSRANIAIANVNFVNTAMQIAFDRANTTFGNAVNAIMNTAAGGTATFRSNNRFAMNFRDTTHILIGVDTWTQNVANITVSANSVLPNVSSQAGATFVGNLTVSGTTVRDTRGGVAYDVRQASLFQPAGLSGASYILSGTDAGRTLIWTGNTIFVPSGNISNPLVPGDTIEILNANTSGRNNWIAVYPAVNAWTSGNISHTTNYTRFLLANSVAKIVCITANTFSIQGAVF